MHSGAGTAVAGLAVCVMNAASSGSSVQPVSTVAAAAVDTPPETNAASSGCRAHGPSPVIDAVATSVDRSVPVSLRTALTVKMLTVAKPTTAAAARANRRGTETVEEDEAMEFEAGTEAGTVVSELVMADPFVGPNVGVRLSRTTLDDPGLRPVC